MRIEQAESLIADLLTAEKEKKPYGGSYSVIQRSVHRIKPHAVQNYVPENLLKNRAPNATDEQIKYVKDNWKATTLPVFHDLLNVVQRGFIDDNWQIIWSDEAEDFREYCELEFPMFGSTETLIKEVVPPIKYQDPNALLAVRPKRFFYLEDEDGNLLETEEGELIVDDTQRLEPAAYIHTSDKVLVRGEGYYVAVDDEKSVVEYNGKKVKDGRVLYIYTKNEIYKAEQVGKKIDNDYEIYLYYQHDSGKCPATELKGIPEITHNGDIIQRSPFTYAVDLLDLALTNKNYLQVSVNNVVFPFRIMMADPCTFANEEGYCSSGKWVLNENGMHSGQCRECKGTGQKSPYSPLGTYLWKKPDNLDQASIPFKPVEFVEAPTQGLEFIEKLVEADTNKAREILHLQKTQAQNTGDVTATETVYNDNGQISFVRYNVHQLFDLWYWLLETVAWQRYDSYDYVPELVYPRTFDFRSEEDIWKQIKLARESEAPVAVIHDLFKALINNLYASSPTRLKVFETITDADRLFALSDMDIASRKASNTIEGWEVVLHDSAIQLVNELIREDESYLEKEQDERVNLLINKAKSINLATNQTVDPVQRLLNNEQ